MTDARSRVALGIALAALLAAVFLILRELDVSRHIREFLLAIVVLLAGLAGLAAALKALDVTGPTPEAFGLPPGTVRAFLAIGLLIVLFLFADQQLQALEPQPLRPMGFAPAPADAAAQTAAISQFDRAGVIAVLQGDGAERRFALYATGRSEERSRLAATIINGLMTLVASVVSFYFGARAVQDAGAAAGAAAAAALHGASPGGTTPGPTPPPAPSPGASPRADSSP